MSALAERREMTEDETRDLLECVLRPNGPVCPYCRAINEAAKLRGKATRPGL